MHVLKRLALISAVAMISSTAFGMEAMDDSAMSSTTGQDGIDIITNLNVGSAGTTVLTYTDTNGITGGTYTSSGDLNIRGFKLSGALTTSIDVGANAGGSAALQIKMTAPSITTSFSGIDVCKTPASGICAAGTSVLTTPVGGVSVTINNFGMNLQLGTSPQGHLGLLSNGATPISVTIGSGAANQVVINDANNTNGGIGLGQLAVTGLDLGDGSTAAKSTFIDACSATVTANCANGAGLQVSFGSSTMAAVGVTMTKVTLGDVSATPSNPIGNVTLTNLSLSGTSIRIVGHN